MSDFRTDLKAVLVDELNSRWDGGVYGSINPEDIIDIRVTWDDGDRYNPTYGGDSTAPTFEVEVTLSDARGGQRVRVDTAWTFTALLKAVLAIGDQQ